MKIIEKYKNYINSFISIIIRQNNSSKILKIVLFSIKKNCFSIKFITRSCMYILCNSLNCIYDHKRQKVTEKYIHKEEI